MIKPPCTSIYKYLNKDKKKNSLCLKSLPNLPRSINFSKEMHNLKLFHKNEYPFTINFERNFVITLLNLGTQSAKRFGVTDFSVIWARQDIVEVLVYSLVANMRRKKPNFTRLPRKKMAFLMWYLRLPIF